MGSINHLKKAVNKSKLSLKEHQLRNVQVIVKDDFIEPINLDHVLKTIEEKILPAFLSELDVIYIGVFPQLKAKSVESAFMNGAIFISNEIIDEETLLKSIIHEIAHNVESIFNVDVYGDQNIADEFLQKRSALRAVLEAHKLHCDPRLYMQTEYSKTFDDFLYKTVGYDKLTALTTKIFISPYAATSLREYFANGFEHYFLDDNQKYLSNISPKLFKKIDYLTYNLN